MVDESSRVMVSGLVQAVIIRQLTQKRNVWNSLGMFLAKAKTGWGVVQVFSMKGCGGWRYVTTLTDSGTLRSPLTGLQIDRP